MRKIPKWLWWVLGVGGAFYVLFLMPIPYALMKPFYYSHTEAIQIAVGIHGPENAYDFDRIKENPEMTVPTCEVKREGGIKKIPYWVCVSASSSKGVGCGVFREPLCVSVKMKAYILSKPKLFTKAIDAMSHPCRYFPSPEKIRQYVDYGKSYRNDSVELQKLNKHNNQEWFLSKWRELRCDTHPDRYPGKVVLTIYDDVEHKTVLTIVKDKDE